MTTFAAETNTSIETILTSIQTDLLGHAGDLRRTTAVSRRGIVQRFFSGENDVVWACVLPERVQIYAANLSPLMHRIPQGKLLETVVDFKVDGSDLWPASLADPQSFEVAAGIDKTHYRPKLWEDGEYSLEPGYDQTGRYSLNHTVLGQVAELASRVAQTELIPVKELH